MVNREEPRQPGERNQEENAPEGDWDRDWDRDTDLRGYNPGHDQDWDTSRKPEPGMEPDPANPDLQDEDDRDLKDFRHAYAAGISRPGGGQSVPGQGSGASRRVPWSPAPEWVTGETGLVPEGGLYPERGPYSGVGPRGYQRKDERIREDVIDRLTQHGQIDARQIEVQVHSGEVILSGSVNSRQEKRLADNIGHSVLGVWDVHNRLQVPRSDRRSEQGQSAQQARIQDGMEVVGRDGNRIGRVKAVRAWDFLVERTDGPDLYIPFSVIESTAGQIQVRFRADEADNQGWNQPQVVQGFDQ